ncbi:C-type lectin domain family 6 member A-like [Asterias amurensis]|uniref:C-type lectin domain family 6 member A-like n=1 Tax=Asterias amurensis TaxID=7602 RepID=UPI003AB230A8
MNNNDKCRIYAFSGTLLEFLDCHCFNLRLVIMKQAGLLLGLICSNFLIECFGDDGKCAAFIGGGCLTWSQWEDKCYKVTEQLPWDKAKQECIKMGGVLVVPQLDGETDFLLKLYNQGFWIGCNQHNNPGIWICKEGNTELQNRNWNGGNPINSSGNCSVIQKRGAGKWDAQACTTPFVGMCKRAERPLLHF